MNIAAGISDEDQDMFDYATVSHGLYIGGRWQPSSEGRVIEVVDPSTEAVIAAVPDATLAVTSRPAAGFPSSSVTWTTGCTAGSNTSSVNAETGGLVVITMPGSPPPSSIAVARKVTGEPSRPLTEAVVACSPGSGPSTRVTNARPSDPVSTFSEETLPTP